MLIRSSIVILVLGLTFGGGKSEESEWNSGVRLLMKLYEDCQKKGFVPCVKMKAITFFERAGRTTEITLADNLSIVRDSKIPISGKEVLTEKELEESLPRGNEEARDSRLNSILFNRIADFFNSYRLVFTLPKLDPNEIKEGVEEGRGKMKKMMSMMMMGFAMKMAAVVPLVLGLLFILAGKALVISKLALVMTLLMALKRIISQKQSYEMGWQGNGGWDRRSYIPHMTAQELAYRGHLLNSITSPGKH